MNIDWIESTEKGFYCSAGDFFIDPKGSVHRAVVSHAHADHYPRLLGEVYGHPASLDLAYARYRNAAGKLRYPIAFGQTFELGDVQIEFFPAGHMLGSCQVLLRHLKKGQTVLYSGDFALDNNPTCTPLAYPDESIDLLICESTFGEKALHSEPEEQMKALLAQDKLPFLIAVYAMGKGQRISALLQSVDPQLTVLVHRSILPFHKVYQKHGVDLGEFEPYQRRLSKSLPRFAYLIPPRMLSSFADDYRYRKVFASGWDHGNKHHYLDDRLAISDHASADDIRVYIGKVEPKEVLFWHGYPESLIAWCKEKGIAASGL